MYTPGSCGVTGQTLVDSDALFGSPKTLAAMPFTSDSAAATPPMAADCHMSRLNAGAWKAGALAMAFNGQDPLSPDFDMIQVGYADQGGLASTRVQRYSRLTVNAAPEPVRKGKTLTATGKLTRANWETNTYKGYTKQAVEPQFRKAGTSTYKTVKPVYSDSSGNVTATTTAKYDGYWRLRFEGTSTTPAVSATGDHVDVR